MIVHDDIHEAYRHALEMVYYESEYICAPRGQKIREITDYTFRVYDPVSEPIITRDPERNKTIESYTAKEVELYDSCTNDVKDFAKASKFWKQLANPDGTVNSAYGYLIWKNRSHGNSRFELGSEHAEHDFSKANRTPWEWCVESLKRDKDTRQAILRFNLPEHAWIGNKDFACTMHGNFMIREDKLNLSITMRSNDLMKGLVYDLPWFVSLMDKMIDELKDVYPGLQKGHYTHTAHSMHLYERDKEAILKMLGAKQ